MGSILRFCLYIESGPINDACGHGIGTVYHDEPQVLHFGRPGTGLVLEPGMIFTVEPMLNAGKPGTKQLADGWTVVTKDRSLYAQWEHMVAVTESRFGILTSWPDGYGDYSPITVEALPSVALT
jgi:methionyl aminopeptidase